MKNVLLDSWMLFYYFISSFWVKFLKSGDIMLTRKDFLNYLLISITAFVTSIFAISCGAKPDAETEPSPEWPPKE